MRRTEGGCIWWEGGRIPGERGGERVAGDGRGRVDEPVEP